MIKERVFAEILKVANRQLAALEAYLKIEEPKGFLKAGDRFENRMEFSIGLQRFVLFLEIKFGEGQNVSYHLITKEIIINNADYGRYALAHKSEMDIVGEWDFMYFQSPKTQTVAGREFDAAAINDFPSQYIYQLLKTL